MLRRARQDKLLCTAGPPAGREFPLEKAKVIVGRASDAAIAIADRSVSRRHLELRSDRLGWLVRDLGSGNGTLLNGEPLTRERRLRHADVLTLGETKLTFTGSRARADQTLDDPPPKRRRGAAQFALIAAAAGALVAIGAVSLKLRADRMHAARREAAAQAELAAAFKAGKDLVREGRWEEALRSFERLRQVAPDYPGLQAYLDRCRIEAPNQEQLAAAGAAIARNELRPAASTLGKVSADTLQQEQLAAVRLALSKLLLGKLAEARDALDRGEPETALELLKDPLQTFPENAEAKALEERAQQKLAERSDARSPRRVGGPWEPPVDRYRRGELAQAIELASRCANAGVPRCESLLKRMREVQRLRRDLQVLPLAQLERLLDLDRQIGGGKSTPAVGAAMTRAADLYYKRAAAANAAGQWSRAMDLASKTLDAQPGHPEAAALVADMKARAREHYLLGYAVKDSAPDEALRRMREVVAMTSAGDEMNHKAAEWIEKLSR